MQALTVISMGEVADHREFGTSKQRVSNSGRISYSAPQEAASPVFRSHWCHFCDGILHPSFILVYLANIFPAGHCLERVFWGVYGRAERLLTIPRSELRRGYESRCRSRRRSTVNRAF